MKMKYRAYWLHESGEIIPVETTHITTVISQPGRLGYTPELIAEIQLKYDHMGIPEQRFSTKITDDLIRHHGWIRIHFKPENDSWGVQLHTLTDSIKSVLTTFFSNTEITGGKYSGVDITELFRQGGMKNRSLNLSELNGGDFFREIAPVKIYPKIEKYDSSNFIPYLMRVGSLTRPSSIAMAGLCGMNILFCVGSYPELKNVQLEEQLVIIRKALEADEIARKGRVPFFGINLGYIFYPEHDKFIALSRKGNVMKDVHIEQTKGAGGLSYRCTGFVETDGMLFPQYECIYPVIPKLEFITQLTEALLLH